MTNSEKIDDLTAYLNEALKLSVITLDFKNLYKFDNETLQNLNKFHDENKKIIGTIETILQSKNIDKYCVDKSTYVPPIYPDFSTDTFARIRSFSDHPRPFTDSLLNNFKIDDVSEPPTAEAKENKYESIFDTDIPVLEFPNIKIDTKVKQELQLEKPKKINDVFPGKLNGVTPAKKVATSYTSLIPIKSNMVLHHLTEDDEEFIKNPEDFENVQFYYYTDPKYFDGEKLYLHQKNGQYYVADNGKLYMLDPNNSLIPAYYDSKIQLWKKKLI
jgi:hypothetical protein